ncbi:MAG TPA: GAF domain-containing protein, partial [Pyrinomonadaceae bacterium]
MPENTRVLHAFAALADLGEEIAETSDFEEMVRSALHVVLGAMGIRRGAVAEFERGRGALHFVAARGYDEALAQDFTLEPQAPNGNGAGSLSHAIQDFARVEHEVHDRFAGAGLEVVTPLVVRGELVGVILLGGKASGEPFTQEDRELARALGRH